MSRKEDFRFLGEIGRGSFGKVDKVRRKEDGKVCVCKQILLDALKSQKQREQALNEAKIMRKLDCPHIVEYLDAFIQQGSLFLVLMFCTGGDLKSFLKKASSLPNRSIWRYILKISLGVQYLHGKRILHRDLKSENIFLHGPDEGLRVGDLGLAKWLDCSQSCATTLVGTPRYLSPEEVRGLAHYNDKCDVWSLGVILYELCNDGHRGPFDQACKLPELMKAILEEEPPELPSRLEQLKDLCSQLLKKDPVRRLSVSQMLALQHVKDSGEKYGIWKYKDGSLVSAPASLTSGSAVSEIGLTGSTLLLDATAARPRGAVQRVDTGEADTVVREVRDSCFSSFAIKAGLRTGESGLGASFKRLAHCEICRAQGAARSEFGLFFRRHHCRSCGASVCDAHSSRMRMLAQKGYETPQRICDACSQLPSESNLEAPNGRLLLVAAAEKAFVWNTSCVAEKAWSTGEQLLWVGLSASSTTPPARSLCTLESREGSPFVFHALDQTGRELSRVALSKPSSAAGASAEPANDCIELVACDGRWVAAKLATRALISIVDVISGKCIGYSSVTGTAGEDVTALALQSGSDGFMVTGSEAGSVRVWGVPGNTDVCQLRCVLTGHKDAVVCIAIGCGGGFVCSGSKDGTVRLWRRHPASNMFIANLLQAICEDYCPTGPSSLCCDGCRLAFVHAPRPSSTYEQGVSVLNLASGQLERLIGKKGHLVNCVALRGTMIATSSTAARNGVCTIQLWHAQTGIALSEISHPAPVTSLLLVESDEDAGST